MQRVSPFLGIGAIVGLAVCGLIGLAFWSVPASSAAGQCPKKPLLVTVDNGQTFTCSPNPNAMNLDEGGDITVGFKLKGKPKKNRVVWVGLRPTWYNAGINPAKAHRLRNLTYSPGQTFTFTPSNWSQAQYVTISHGEDNKDRRNLNMTLRNKINGKWKGRLVQVYVNDND